MQDDANLPPNCSYRITLTLANAAATRSLGIHLGESLLLGSVILLEGELGAGKTTLVQGLGEGLGITEPIDSPTFTLINEYLDGRIPLYHFDLYRLNAAEIEALYLETYWTGEVEPGIVAIEWAQRLPYQPPDCLHIRLTYDAETGRQATLTAKGHIQLPLPL
jgi:tRNA threonylcarbamoyladenosine biosynthesis protein TsaE